MSLLAVVEATPSITPVVTPIVHTVTQVVTVNVAGHLFQLAEIVKYLALGAGLSFVQFVLHGKFGLPKWVNIVLPIVYAAIGGLAITVVDNTVNWADWYQVFLQVLAGASGLYALVTVVNTASASKPSLPVVDQP